MEQEECHATAEEAQRTGALVAGGGKRRFFSFRFMRHILRHVERVRVSEIANNAAGAALGVAAMLFLHRYYGIYHDAILYMGQVMAQLRPEVMFDDPFFLHGGQERYSILPWLLGKMALSATLPSLFLLGTLASLFLFAFASWYALSAMLPTKQRYWAWLGVLLLPSIYGATRIFSYNENFLTARPFAEVLCLLAVGSFVRKRWLSGGACIVFAALLHPLQALSAGMVMWTWASIKDRRWLHALWAAVPVLLLAFADVEPFDGLLHSFDPEWLAASRTSTHLFVAGWEYTDYTVLFFDAILLAIGSRLLSEPMRRWCFAGLVGLCMGIGASLLLVDGMNLVLPTGLQLWRVHWLVHWLAVATLAALLFLHMQEQDIGRAIILALAAHLAWGGVPSGMALTMCLYLAWPRMVSTPRERLRPLLASIFTLGLLLLFAQHVTTEWSGFSAAGRDLATYPLDTRLLTFPALALGLPLLGHWAWDSSGPRGRLLLGAALLSLSLLAAVRWDARLPHARALEADAGQPAVFGSHLPMKAQVLWQPESLVGTWLVLGRASYYSHSQTAGQMFDRDTFLDLRARASKVWPLLVESERCRQAIAHGTSCTISPGTLRHVCSDGDVAPPDYLVLPFQQAESPVGTWTPRNPIDGSSGVTFRLFRCRDLVADTSDTAPQQPIG